MGMRSHLVVPLVAGGRVLGVLSLVMASPGRRYGATEVTLAEEVAARAALALDQARLYVAEQASRAAAEAAARRTAHLQAVTAALSGAATPEAVAEAALRAGLTAVGATAGGIGVLVDGGSTIERLAMLGYPEEFAAATHHLPLADLGSLADAVRTGTATWLEANRPVFPSRPDLDSILESGRYGAAVSAPLAVGGRVIGLLVLRFAEERPGDPEDSELVVAIAGQCAQALERARLYVAEQEAREEAEAAVRARDTFFSIAAHELKTPITSLKGAVQLLLRRHSRGELDVERLARALGTLNGSVNRLSRLVDDLLDVARIRTGQLALDPHDLDLAALVRAAVEHTREGLHDGQRLLLAAPDEPVPVVADEARIDQVLTNLLDNAFKYSPNGGPVTVEIGRDGDGARVTIRDQGIGLPVGAAEMIFQPFGRAENATRDHYQGMGLGLSICRTIVERHGGWIRAESAGEGHGTTVMFWLPAVSTLGERTS
jgi:signal transduction histidine kinase